MDGRYRDAGADGCVTHKHHEGQDGCPRVAHDDLFLLVQNPLSKRPHYFVGHSPVHGVQTVRTACVAKRMDHLTAKAWHDFLLKAGHDFFLCTHEEKARAPRIKFLSAKLGSS